MRHLLAVLALLVLAATAARAEFIIPPPGLVVDQVGALSVNQRKDLENFAIALREASHPAALAILIIDHVPDGDIENYAVTVGRAWKLGRAGVDDGLLMLYAVGDHRYRFEVGPGLQGTLTDGAVGDMARQYFVPWVKAGNLHRAFNETIWAIAERLGNPEAVGAAVAPPPGTATTAAVPEPAAAPAPEPPPAPTDDTGFYATLAVMAAIIVLAIVLRRSYLWASASSATLAAGAMVYFAQPIDTILIWSLVSMLFNAFMVLIARNPIEALGFFLSAASRTSGGSSDSSSSGSSSSDSGSFGGGSFDGGGASGRTD